MPKQAFNPAGVPAPAGAYSQVAVVPAGRLAFIAGQVAIDRDGQIVGAGDVKAQTRQTLENLKAAVAAVGAGVEDIASVTVFVTDISQFAAVQEVRQEYFSGELPASTLVEVSRLAHPDLLIEINAIASLPA